ncbi:hypothetical protein [Desertibacillus haloalkaliphilus]|uniref:hypothetical protein n=1 Tax=Desertibacillus haloalkaliphilus TaxID=1328930 RepID=UPI001C267147|nr:hypothetical protein [Desertibacillus haloalkaliphilus]MBU8905245.1 hypothetical protein [Desertibacillus haloalkaliphilus]
MHLFPLLYLSCIIAGFALVRVPLTGTFQPLSPLADIVGVLTILLFSCVIIYNGIVALIGRGRKL